MDLKISFLNGEVEKEIYMRQPKGFVQTNKNNLVCKLNKSIYGLKQNLWTWYACIKTYLLWNDFAPNFAHKCVCQKSGNNVCDDNFIYKWLYYCHKW